MTSKSYWLQPSDAADWLAPDEVVTRLEHAFDNVIADREEGQRMAECFLTRYRRLMEFLPNTEEATPLKVVERSWRDALVVLASDESELTAPFRVVVKTEHRLELEFLPQTPFQRKRRTTEKVASALGYAIDHFDPDTD